VETRETWSGRDAFLLAAIGSAIGLGNLWRFPFKCYENGGGAFLIAYLIALLTAGVPLLILELSLGHRYQLAAPMTFARISKKFEWIGWWAVLIGFVITTYYAVIMAWGLNYTVFSLTQKWGDNTGDFFFHEFLGITKGHFELGGIRLPIVISLLISWFFIIASIWKGAKTASKVVYFTVFLPWLLLIVFVIRGITLPGSIEGLKFYLEPHFEKLADASVWITAFGQVFFSLSIGFGIMIAYASFLPKHIGIINNALIIALSDGATAFIGGFAVFGSLGYYAHLSGQTVQQVLKGGPGLAFVSYPTIINHLPMPKIFGFLFFIMLLALAIDSAFSLVEAVTASLRDKYGWSHKKSNLIVAGLAFTIGILFTTGAGLYWLDVVDKWVEVFGLSVIILIQAIVIGWYYRLEKLRNYANLLSEVKVGTWWNVLIRFILPIVIGALIITEAYKLITQGYDGYSQGALLIGGWLVVLLLPILALLISKSGNSKETSQPKMITPKIPFIYETGFKRLYVYFQILVITGIILIIINLLNSSFLKIENVVIISVGFYMTMALIGGAIYFVMISVRDQNKRKKWVERAFDEK
jgi:NSS family neurotransmitter:Na+ symporter